MCSLGYYGRRLDKIRCIAKVCLVHGDIFPEQLGGGKGIFCRNGHSSDPKKNRMKQATLDAHMQIRFDVESELSYDKNNCNQCNSTRKRPHCHCSKAVINEEMLNLFNEAYKMIPEEQRDEAEITEQKHIA